MTGFNINELKEELRDTLRIYLYPHNLVSDVEVKLSDTLDSSTVNFKVAQSFKPYSKFYVSTVPYRNTVTVNVKLRKYGSPDGNVIVSLQSSSNDQPSGSTIGSYTIPSSSISSSNFEVNTGYIKITEMLGSNTRYWLVIEPTNTESTVNYYSTQKSSIDTYLSGSIRVYNGNSWNTSTGDIYFDINNPHFVFQDYPRTDLSKHSYPRVSVDMIARRVNQRWIDSKIAEYNIDTTIVGYSYYPDELDEILSICDRALFKERTNMSNIKRIDPAEMTPTAVLMDNLFSRALRYNIVYRMQNT